MTGEWVAAVADERAAPAGDRLASLFDAHHRRLYVLARRLSSDADAARDLVQETFVRAARAPSAVPSGARAEEAWLVRVLVNLCRDRWRRAAGRARLDATLPSVALAPPASADPERAFVARAVVWHALNALSPRRRAVIVLHELEGESVAAIARLLGVTAVTVRWHLSRGRKELARLIRGEEKG